MAPLQLQQKLRGGLQASPGGAAEDGHAASLGPGHAGRRREDARAGAGVRNSVAQGRSHGVSGQQRSRERHGWRRRWAREEGA